MSFVSFEADFHILPIALDFSMAVPVTWVCITLLKIMKQFEGRGILDGSVRLESRTMRVWRVQAGIQASEGLVLGKSTTRHALPASAKSQEASNHKSRLLPFIEVKTQI